MRTWVLVASVLFFAMSCSAHAKPNVPPGFPPDFDMSPPKDGEETTEISVEFVDDAPEVPTPDAPPPSASIPDPPQETKSAPQETARETSGATETPAKGDKGDPGEKGDRGDTGPQGVQGVPGVNADLCSNIAGIQTQPGWKKWPQRYWSFRPKKEKRVLSVNKRGHLVCVTQRWIRTHSMFAKP